MAYDPSHDVFFGIPETDCASGTASYALTPPEEIEILRAAQ